uniref:Uncharacterized protein n=1 Tax=Manihot esculenta TaxID=3983 RepID=A0A2C9VHA8_MANES
MGGCFGVLLFFGLVPLVFLPCQRWLYQLLFVFCYYFFGFCFKS